MGRELAVEHEVEMAEEEEIRLGMGLQISAGKGIERACVAFLCGCATCVGEAFATAAERPFPGKAERPPRVDRGIEHLTESIAKDALDEAVFSGLVAHLIAVSEEKVTAEQLHSQRAAMDDSAHFGGQVIEHPNVMVADEEVDFHAGVVQLGQFAQETHVAAGHDVAVLVPIVEHVTQKVDGRGIRGNAVHPADEPLLVGHGIGRVTVAEMGVGGKVDLLHRGKVGGGAGLEQAQLELSLVGHHVLVPLGLKDKIDRHAMHASDTLYFLLHIVQNKVGGWATGRGKGHVDRHILIVVDFDAVN